jgi:hypothetical protein
MRNRYLTRDYESRIEYSKNNSGKTDYVQTLVACSIDGVDSRALKIAPSTLNVPFYARGKDTGARRRPLTHNARAAISRGDASSCSEAGKLMKTGQHLPPIVDDMKMEAEMARKGASWRSNFASYSPLPRDVAFRKTSRDRPRQLPLLRSPPSLFRRCCFSCGTEEKFTYAFAQTFTPICGTHVREHPLRETA